MENFEIMDFASNREYQKHLNSRYKSVWVAYILWLFLGILGGHRFYLRRWLTGFFYAISLGFYGFGLLIDIFLIPLMVKQENRKIEEREIAEPAAEEIKPTAQEPQLASWAYEQSALFVYLQLPLRILFFVLGPLFFVGFAVLMARFELIAIMVVILAVTGFGTDIGKHLQKHTAMEHIPGLGEGIKALRTFYEYYAEHRPSGILYYIFYPVFGFLAMLFFPLARKEFKLYARLLGGILLLLIIENLFSYTSLYPPYLTWEDALKLVFVQLALAFIMIIAFMMPTITSSFALHLSGRKKMLQLCTILALIISVPFGIFMFIDQINAPYPPFLSGNFLEERLTKDAFRRDLAEATEMFLEYNLRRLPPNIPDGVAASDELTQAYQRHVGGVVVDDEAKAFRIVTIIRKSDGAVWMGVRLEITDDKPIMLYLMDSKRLYTSWRQLPADIRQMFVQVEHFKLQGKYSGVHVRHLCLIDELPQ